MYLFYRINKKKMEKLNLSKKYKDYFTAKIAPQLLDTGPAQYVSLRGKGDPSDAGFMEKIRALYATAYGIKFICKTKEKDFVVSKLEGLWWFDEQKFGHYSMSESAQKVPRKEWEYRLMIRMPDYITTSELGEAIENVATRKGIKTANEIVWFEMDEGLCIQTLHIGPFSAEPETLERIDAFSKNNQLSKNGLHHEIYLSDFNRTDPLKLKTILREPVIKYRR